MKRLLGIFVFCILLFGIASASNYVHGEAIVKYKEDSRPRSFSLNYDFEKGKRDTLIKFDGGDDFDEIISELSLSSEIEYVEPNYIYSIFLEPNDSEYSSQWSLPKVQSEEAWNITFGSEDVVIAIIDTGVEWDHIDLSENIWNNSDEDCFNGIDDDSNGYVDDCRGYDFVDFSASPGVTCTDSDCYDEDNDPMDSEGHGTHCAGISAAVTNNSNQIAGICPNCKIMPVRAGYKCAINANCSSGANLNVLDISEAIHYAADNGADIISMSFGGQGTSQTLQDAVNYATTKGCILVAAAGNSNSDVEEIPAAYSNVISVGSTNSSDMKAASSNYGSWVDIVAPGDLILSTILDDQIGNKSGTSMATPLVAGAIGLIKSVLIGETQGSIFEAFNETGVSVDFVGENKSRIDIYSALLYLDDIAPQINFTAVENGSISPYVNQTFIFNFTDWQLKNATFILYNDSSIVNESYFNISGLENSSVLFFENLSYGDYTWGCSSFDENGNYFALDNRTFSITSIFVELNDPENNTYTNLNESSFNCSAKAASGLDNLTFYLWNSSGVENFSLINISGNENSSVFYYNFSEEGIYFWSCEAYGDKNYLAENFTITYDATFPSIDNLSESVTYNSAEITFDSSEDVNYSLNYSGGNINSSIYSDSKSISLTGLVASATYEYNLNVCDRATNCNFTISSFITSSAPVQNLGGGGGGGGFTVQINGTKDNPVLYRDIVSGGYFNRYKKGDVRYFQDADKENHSIRLEDLIGGIAVIVIESKPIRVHLLEGQSYKLNLTDEVNYDFEIFLEKIEGIFVDLNIAAISEPIVVEKDLVISDEEIDSVELKGWGIGNILFIVLVLIVLGIIFWILNKDKEEIKSKKTSFGRGKEGKKIKTKAKRKR